MQTLEVRPWTLKVEAWNLKFGGRAELKVCKLEFEVLEAAA